MTKTVKNMSFSKGACKTKNKAPAASLKRRNNGLGLPIHIKKLPIVLNIRYYIILPIYQPIICHFLDHISTIYYLLFPIENAAAPLARLRLQALRGGGGGVGWGGGLDWVGI